MTTSTLTLTPPNEGIINMSASRRSGRSRAATGPSITRRATLLVLVGLLPSCLARLSAGASMSSADIVAATAPAIVVGNAPIDGILTTTDRELGSKSSKSKSSKSKSSKSKSSKTKSSKTKSSKSKSSKKKKKKSSVFNKAGDSSSQSKKNKKSSSKSSSKSKKSSSSSDKKKKSSSDEKRKDSSKSDSDKTNKAPDMDDITEEVVSILKDRKNVVNGKDKTKDLDQKDLRNKVLDELGIKDSDRGEAKKMFEDAIEKLEKKDEIKVASDGDVKIFVSMDESDSDSDSDDKKKKSESLELTDVTKEVVSILKDRKKVVDGEDKTKTLDQKKLRDKVLDELDVKDSDRGEAKDLFEEALKKLEKKDEIKVNGDGDVKIHVSMDDSKDSSSSDEKDFRSSTAKTTGGIFGQATVEDIVPTDDTNSTSVNNNGLDTSVLPTDPDATVPLDNGDSIIIIDQAVSNEADEAENGAVEGATSANETGDDVSAPNKNEADVPTDAGESTNENDTSDVDADSLANGVEDGTENINGDASTIDLSGKSDGSCGTGCKVGVSFASVGLLVGVASVAAKMAMAKKDGEEEDFESDEEEEEEEEAENDSSQFTPAAEEEV